MVQSTVVRHWIKGFPYSASLKLCCCCSGTQLSLMLVNPMDCSLPDSSVHGILQARLLEQVAISSSKASFQPGDQTRISCVSCLAGGFFTAEPLGKPPYKFGVDAKHLRSAIVLTSLQNPLKMTHRVQDLYRAV